MQVVDDNALNIDVTAGKVKILSSTEKHRRPLKSTPPFSRK